MDARAAVGLAWMAAGAVFCLLACEPERVFVGVDELMSDTLVIDSTRVVVRDSAVFPLPGGSLVTARPGELVSALGPFERPGGGPRLPELGTFLSLEVELSGDAQRNEAFGVAVDGGRVGGCAVPDRPWLGRGFVPAGIWHDDRAWSLRITHAALLDCYEPVGGRFEGPNSVHFRAARFGFYREVPR